MTQKDLSEQSKFHNANLHSTNYSPVYRPDTLRIHTQHTDTQRTAEPNAEIIRPEMDSTENLLRLAREAEEFRLEVQRQLQEQSRQARRKFWRIVRMLLTWALLIAAAVFVRVHYHGAVTYQNEPVQIPEQEEQDTFLVLNPWSRPGTPLKQVNGIVIHYVGNPGSSAKGNRDYFNSLASGELQTYASSHFVVGLQGEVIQCIPLNEIAYASNQRNQDTIAIEVCHPDESGKFNDITYASVIRLTAQLCRDFHLDPASDIIRHYDVTGKICPRYYVNHPEAWEQFKLDVARVMDDLEREEREAENLETENVEADNFTES